MWRSAKSPHQTSLERKGFDLSDQARPRKILFVQTQAENAGAQEISRILGESLAARGHDVHHLFFFRRTSGFDNQPNTEFCALERPSNPLAFARFLLALFHAFRRIKPDVTLPLQHYGNVIGGIVARVAGLKNIVASTTSAPATMNAAVRMADLACGTLGVYDKIIVNSEDTQKDYGKWPLSYRNRMVRIDHGFEDKTAHISKFDARAALNLPQNITLLGCVARLHPLKCLDANIALLSDNADWHYAHAGQGAELEPLLALAKSLGCLERVHFLGEISPKSIGTFLAALDVFVFPSASETFGLAPVEAAQTGTPVVANQLPVLKEVLESDAGPCAIFTDTANPSAFAEAVKLVLSDDALRHSISSSGRLLQQRYSLDAMVDGYEALIDQQFSRNA